MQTLQKIVFFLRNKTVRTAANALQCHQFEIYIFAIEFSCFWIEKGKI